MGNIIKDPKNNKYREISKISKKFSNSIGKYKSGIQLLLFAGFVDSGKSF